jgi:flagellar protein FliO/FliZ
MDTAVLALRTVLALVVVVGLVVVLGRVLDDRAAGRTQDGIVSRLLSPFRALLPGRSAAPKQRRRPAAVLTVVGRQGLGPKASVAVVDVGDQRLVLGVSEAGVTLLTSMQAPAVEVEPVEVVEAVPSVATSLVKGGATPGTAPVATSGTAPVVAAGTPAPTSVEPAAPVAFDEVFAGIVAQQPEGAQGATPGLAPDASDAAATEPVSTQPTGTQPIGTAAPVSTSLVAGSVLSPATWRQAVSAVQSRTRR